MFTYCLAVLCFSKPKRHSITKLYAILFYLLFVLWSHLVMLRADLVLFSGITPDGSQGSATCKAHCTIVLVPTIFCLHVFEPHQVCSGITHGRPERPSGVLVMETLSKQYSH